MYRQVSATYEQHVETYKFYGWTPLDRQTWQSWHNSDIANGYPVVGCNCHFKDSNGVMIMNKVFLHSFASKSAAEDMLQVVSRRSGNGGKKCYEVSSLKGAHSLYFLPEVFEKLHLVCPALMRK